MEEKNLYIEKTPVRIWGPRADHVYLYVHGQGGNREEAKEFAEIAAEYGYQVLSMDLPEHGARPKENPSFEPWNVVPELSRIMVFCKQNWTDISLFANSIGAWFSMLAFANGDLKDCLFVSPVVDMVDLISHMMARANVSESRLAQEKQISTDFGQTLSWQYWLYAREHPVRTWNSPTRILSGEKDTLVDTATIEAFSKRFGCAWTVMKEGEHWFHTGQQLGVLFDWVRQSFASRPICQNGRD